MENIAIQPANVFQALKRIKSSIIRTPLIHSILLTEQAGVPIYLKLENLQNTGSFKFRGATNKLLSLSDREKALGVITVSSGNHGRAVAYTARRLGIKAVICLSEKTPKNKIEGIRRCSPEVMIQGSSYDEAELVAIRLGAERGLVFIDSFDDPQVIAGQGTIGFEIFEDLPEVENILAPVSGGGLASGVSLFAKYANPDVNMLGVSMERAPVMVTSLKLGHQVTLPEEPTLADGLKGGIGLENHYTFKICQQLLDDTLLVSEEEIASAMTFLFKEHRLVVEGSGAVGVAAVMSGKFKPRGKTVIILSGSNVDIPVLMEIVNRNGLTSL
jgi:threonine dehydratase